MAAIRARSSGSLEVMSGGIESISGLMAWTTCSIMWP